MAGPGKNFRDYSGDGPTITESFTEDWQPQPQADASTIAQRLENTPESGRKVNLIDKSSGAMVHVDERDLGALLHSGAFDVASPEQVAAEREKSDGGGLADLGKGAFEALQAADIAFKRGAFDAVTALPRAAVAGAAALAGEDFGETYHGLGAAKTLEGAVG
jgi:hypothetical protein